MNTVVYDYTPPILPLVDETRLHIDIVTVGFRNVARPLDRVLGIDAASSFERIVCPAEVSLSTGETRTRRRLTASAALVSNQCDTLYRDFILGAVYMRRNRNICRHRSKLQVGAEVCSHLICAGDPCCSICVCVCVSARTAAVGAV